MLRRVGLRPPSASSRVPSAQPTSWRGPPRPWCRSSAWTPAGCVDRGQDLEALGVAVVDQGPGLLGRLDRLAEVRPFAIVPQSIPQSAAQVGRYQARVEPQAPVVVGESLVEPLQAVAGSRPPMVGPCGLRVQVQPASSRASARMGRGLHPQHGLQDRVRGPPAALEPRKPSCRSRGLPGPARGLPGPPEWARTASPGPTSPTAPGRTPDGGPGPSQDLAGAVQQRGGHHGLHPA
jgi:hypothetical protein